MNDETQDPPEDTHTRIREKLTAVAANVHGPVEEARAALRIQEENSAAIRGLTVAVWTLSVVLFLNVALTVIFVLPAFFSRYPFIPSSVTIAPNSSHAHAAGARYEALRDVDAMMKDSERLSNFHDWPPEKQIQEASAVVIARYQKDGGMMKAIVVEILKQDPKAKFSYKIGDEYAPARRYSEDQERYDDGQLIFFTGSPASMKMSMTFRGDRIGGLGEMPLDLLRKMAKESPSTGPAK